MLLLQTPLQWGSRQAGRAPRSSTLRNLCLQQRLARRQACQQPLLRAPTRHTHTNDSHHSHRLISDHQLETTGSGQLTPGLRLAAGAGAGIVAMSATYPLDMVRGRLTVQEGRNVQYNGIIHATKTIMREVRRGVWGCWRGGVAGLTCRVLRRGLRVQLTSSG